MSIRGWSNEKGKKMKIDYLCNRKEYINVVSKWVFDEFVVGSGSKSSIEDLIEFFSSTSVDDYPITFVAYNESGCLGAISMFENDLKTQNELKPWLASLYVAPQNRNQGVAEELIKSVIQKTEELGYSELYLRTEHTSTYYKKRGWEFVYKTHDEKGQETGVYKFKIK